ncbi:hypothetical protein [Prosthecobacter vanneervenii]|uniref:Uncharacterized protein n=1 Tax=Prosthecobacter vanneervenii TaxID=48466 RepID=A0A7W7YGH7_9BACT|nr:hypothetical protein [Prosthecobacter vanneervenii]MBB5035752.1 hypothetical protein [Prosthecobacter vanneervenii]
MKILLPIFVFAALAPLSAQVLPGAPGAGAPPASTTTNSNNNYNMVPGSASDRQTDTQTALGNMPMADPGSENVSFNGKLWNVTNNRMMRSRFETYLTTPEAKGPEDQAYRDIMAQIMELLSPNHKQAPDPVTKVQARGPEVMKAFALLPEAGTAKIDGGLCNALANAVWDVWTSQKRVNERKLANAAMMERRKQLEWNAEMGLNSAPLAKNGPTSTKSQNNAQVQQNNSATVGRTSGYIKGIAEIEARTKLNETAMGLSEITSKTQFQAMIIQMFLQRRFEHAIIACRFYPNLFRDGESILQLDKGSDVQKILSSSFGVPPTVSMIDGLSLEAIRSVDESLVSFENLVARRDLDSAGNRLLEAYGIGEYLPRVRRLPMTEKAKILDFVRKKNKLLSFLEMKDYASAETVVMELRTASEDFEYAKPLAAIQTAKTMSNLHVNNANAAMGSKDAKTVEAEMKAAAEIWPTNPRVTQLSEHMMQSTDMKSQALMEFDRLISQRNYRQIFENQAPFIAAVADDLTRKQQLEKVLKDMGKLELILGGAKELASSSPPAAWEKVEKESKNYPDDPVLSKLRADLGVKASEFVTAIENARQQEEKQQIGSSLSWYLKARRMHPMSEMAREGIKRMVDTIKNGGQPPPTSLDTPAPTSALNN